MSDRASKSRCGPAAIALLLLATAPVAAQRLDDRPEGLPAGPFLVEPYVRFTYENDDNVFRRNGLVEINTFNTVVSDNIATVWGGAKASLPFRMSLLEFSAELSRFEYQKTTVPQDFTRDFQATGTFNFATGDTVALSERFLQGLSQIQATVGGDGGEETFSGRPFDLNELELEISRAMPGRAGYSVRIRRIDLNWDAFPVPTGAFDYRGWNSSVEFRKPIPGRRWLIFSFNGRRLDHFDADYATAPEPEAPFGVPFRQEKFDSAQVGVRGFQSRGSPFFVQIGYGRFDYEFVEGLVDSQGQPVESSGFRGLVGAGRWRVPIGGRTSLDISGQRRVLPSNLNTHYVNNDLRVHFYREWLRYSTVGIDVRWSGNRYGDLIFDEGANVPDGCKQLRKDRRTLAEAYVSWLPFVRTTFRMALSLDDRNSNCPLFEYDSTRLTAGVSYGWD